MAKTETLTLNIEAQLSKALSDIKRLEQEIKDLQKAAGKPVEIEVKADARAAERTIDDLISDVKKLSAQDAVITLALKAASVQADIDKIHLDIADLSKPTDILIEAPRLAALNGDLGKLKAEIKEIGDLHPEVVVDLDTSRASAGADRLTDSANKSKNAMANMVGNAAQDLGAFAGIAGSAGVALGQLAEGAADARNSGEGMGSVLKGLGSSILPIAAIGIGVGLISSAMQKSKKEAEALEEATRNFTDALGESVGVAEDLDEAITSAFEVGRGSALAVVAQDFQDAIDPAKLNEYRRALSELNLVNSQYVEGLIEGEGSFRGYVEGVVAATDATDAEAKAIAKAVDEGDSLTEIHNLLSGSAQDWFDNNETLVASLEALDDVAGSLNIEDMAQDFLSAQRGIEGETAAVDEAIASTSNWSDALLKYIDIKRQQNAVEQEGTADAERINRLNKQFVEDTNAAIAATQKQVDEQDRMTLSTEELADAMLALEDPASALPDVWEALVGEFGKGAVDLDLTKDMVDQLAQATGLAAEDITAMAVAEAKLREEDLAKKLEEDRKALEELNNELETAALEFGDAEDRAAAFASALEKVNRSSDLDLSIRVIGFVEGMNSVSEALTEANNAGVDFSTTDIVPDSWEEVLGMPEALKPVAEAFVGFRDTVQSEMALAFEEGGSARTREWAADTRQAVTDEIEAMGLETTEEVALIKQSLEELGLTEEQIDIFIAVSGQEQAKAVLNDLSGLIGGLDPETQLRIAVLAETDPLAALELTIAALEAKGVEIPAEMKLLVEQLNADVALVEGTHHDVPFDATLTNAQPTQDKLDEIAAPRTVDIIPRVVKEAGTAGRASEPEDQTQTVTITAVAETADADAELDEVADPRIAQFLTYYGPPADNAEKALDAVAEPRTAKFFTSYGTEATNAKNALDAVAAPRTATFHTNYGTAAINADAALDAVAAPRTAPITVDLRGEEEVARLLDLLDNPRTVVITTRNVNSGSGTTSGGGSGLIPGNNMALPAAGPMAMATADVGVGTLAAPAPMSISPVTMVAPAAGPVTNNFAVTVQAAVVGNRGETERVIAKALRSYTRLNGRRN